MICLWSAMICLSGMENEKKIKEPPIGIEPMTY